ncbi:GTP-binding protein LepA [Limimonas halophila]|uniref:Elongation factor 4 n=1 Tax=Limimonas halophila TaxID=1082479 RepID=A0A1G7L489_9PROT|nr:translation elongation factor 4 [Limimonas halophila]SDF44275.1 GTP-binding protein LepA [Limimonas halophila]
MTDRSRIRNFAIIAHIDHGKSTLADRIITMCEGVSEREMREQFLDNMDLERERGITIKAQTVRLNYPSADGSTYVFNVIDTPGHVDFSYEVSRSLKACEGCILLVDASQGVEAQTLANVYLALEHDLEIIPVLNKVDLPAAEPERVLEELENVIGLAATDALLISAKTGQGVSDVTEAICQRIPVPAGDADAPLKALLVDSWYDQYLGVITLVRVMEGTLQPGVRARMMATRAVHDVSEVGTFQPGRVKSDALGPGELGYMIAGIKDIDEAQVGDTITDDTNPCDKPLEGYKPSVPVVFCGLFPTDTGQYEALRDALGKLRLNDSSFQFEPESSPALGFGFRCGFLGLLHLEIIQERLSREFDLDLITTAPSVVYRIMKKTGEIVDLHNPTDMPNPMHIESVEEPWITATILVPDGYLGNVIKLCEERRGIQKDLTYAGDRAMVVYSLPLNEVVYDFYDRLKSATSGYASFDYQMEGYHEGDLVKLDVLVNSERVDALAVIVHRSQAEYRGRLVCQKLKEEIPRQLFKVPIQAAISGRVVARETVPALKKDVTAKCYGGDVTRKRKLIEKQKEGKKKMRQVGKVEIPQSAFLNALKMDDD